MLRVHPTLSTTQDTRHVKNALQQETKWHNGFETLPVLQPCDNYHHFMNLSEVNYYELKTEMKAIELNCAWLLIGSDSASMILILDSIDDNLCPSHCQLQLQK